MIALGNFTFPEKRTVARSRIVEAKSKVRREVQIQSLLREDDPVKLERQLAGLQEAVESFDRHQASLSLHPERYFMGRRRDFLISPLRNRPIAWVDLTVLTQDRFERSLALHQYEQDTVNGICSMALENKGNWESPLLIQLVPQQSLSKVVVTANGQALEIAAAIEAGDLLYIDAELRRVTLNDGNIYSAATGEFPFLPSGTGDVTVAVTPPQSTAHVTIQFRDYWV